MENGLFLWSQLSSSLSPSSVLSHSTSPTPAPYIKPGSLEDPMVVHVVWVHRRAFRLRWCPKCCFHRPPRTHHCPWCNICVEDFDHHCKWVNNCVGHRNFRLFMLLIVSLCLYSSTLLAISLVFLVRTSHLPFNLDKAMTLVVVVPAAGFLMPLLVLLVSQVFSVSTAERSYEGQCRDLQGYNPFNQGCARNWYLTLFAPLGPPYMSDAVWLQRPLEPEGVLMPVLHSPPCPCTNCHLPCPETPPQPLGHCPGKGPPGGGEAAALQELPTGSAWHRMQETPGPAPASRSPFRPRQGQEHLHPHATT
ncbi:probable palmitoyltransferase ZDHHC19 isoform X2 [Octodon degus]|uniref:Palmitoyltransferase n=1 Tax=Octodon degus TaxID=10160 RepID=A0A6P6DKI2_OCTDE|nr:probable palmitoyltransferase ZDHHC19 isoform X2 [Octodon degus]